MACLLKRNNGVYYAVSFKKGHRKWRSLGTKDEEQAKIMFSELQLNSRKPTQQTLLQFWLMVKPMMAKELAANSIEFYDYIVKKFIAVIGNKRIRSYRIFDFERYKSTRLDEVKKITVNKELRTLKALFERAMRYDYIDSNPVQRCSMLKIDQSVPQMLSAEEFTRLMATINDDNFRRVVIFAVLTAMRAGEILFLEWKDIDINRRSILVRNKLNHRVKMGKERFVPMNDAVLFILNEMEKTGDRVFYRKDGKPYSVKYVSDLFRKNRRLAGLPKEIHFHSLRHTSLSWMHHSGVPSESLRQIAGHSSIQTTQIYTHVLRKHLLEASNTLNKYVFPTTAVQWREQKSVVQ